MRGIDPAAFAADARARGLTVVVGRPVGRVSPGGIEAGAGAAGRGGSAVGKSRPPDLAAASFIPPTSWVLPLVTANEVNGRDWRARSARTQAARRAVSRAFGPHLRALAPVAEHYAAGGAVRAVLTRLGGRRVDPGAVGVTLKAVEDAVCATIGADDGDARWRPEYGQEPGGPAGVRIELTAAG